MKLTSWCKYQSDVYFLLYPVLPGFDITSFRYYFRRIPKPPVEDPSDPIYRFFTSNSINQRNRNKRNELASLADFITLMNLYFYYRIPKPPVEDPSDPIYRFFTYNSLNQRNQNEENQATDTTSIDVSMKFDITKVAEPTLLFSSILPIPDLKPYLSTV